MSTRSATPSASAPPEPPSPMTVAMIGTSRRLISNRLRAIASRLAALLGAESGPRARRVDEREHRHLELLGELHEAERLAVALGVRHAEVAVEVLLGVAAALVADDHDRLAVEARPAADDRGVLAEGAVAVQLDEVGERERDVVERERALGAARHLHALQRREVAVDLRAQLAELLLERRDLRRRRSPAARRRAASARRSASRARRSASRTPSSRKCPSSAPAHETNTSVAQQRAQTRRARPA